MGSSSQYAPQQSEHTGELGMHSPPHILLQGVLRSALILEQSTQILATLAQGPWEETIRIITEPENELGQAYVTMKSLFDQTKKIYTQQDVFLSADKLNIEEVTQREIIRTTNLATFVSGVFAGDVGFYELNDHFLETFVPVGDSLSEEQGHLFLNLKTQVYISALSQEEQERTNEEILYEMFPDNVESFLVMRHPEKPLSQKETYFIYDLKGRRELLLSESCDIESIRKPHARNHPHLLIIYREVVKSIWLGGFSTKSERLSPQSL
jgi:hypothetical protein